MQLDPADVAIPLLQGRQKLDGLWFPSDWFAPDQATRRVLAAWQPGSRVDRFETGLLLRFPAPVDAACETAGGWPLRRIGLSLSSAPVTATEAARLPAADLWIVAGGRVQALMFASAEPVDPSNWLMLDDLVLHDMADFRPKVPALTVAIGTPRPLRAVLGGKVPPASPALQEFLDRLARAQQDGSTERHSGGIGWSEFRPSDRLVQLGIGAAVLGGALAALAKLGSGDLHHPPVDPAAFGDFLGLALGLLPVLLVAWLVMTRRGRSVGSGGMRGTPIAAGRAIPPRPTPAAPRPWRAWLTRLALASQISRLIGRRQGAYLRRMLAMFEEGDLDAALRHAIPLGEGQGSLGQAFGTPSARQNLELSRRLGGSTGISLGDSLQDHLRSLYRQSFERLDREGRIDEAVFVLAELLGTRQEALDYLEKHERFAQAAEMALAWNMPAGLIVRLHCLAGDWQTAVAVARRDNAFATAVTQLTPNWPKVAQQLRQEWADTLAARGDWLQAVEAIWPVASARDQAAAWLRSAEAAGGALGARALIRRAALLPDTIELHGATLAAWRDDPDAVVERNAAATALITQPEMNETTQQVARLLIGAILADHAVGRGTLSRPDLQRATTAASDPLLTADLAGIGLPGTTVEPLAQRRTPLILTPPERGLHAILDAAPADDGRYLLATGEAGALLVDRFGRKIARFPVPAEILVMAESQQVALALARRDGQWRVSRLDLVHRQVTDLGLIDSMVFARDFDGVGWAVAFGDRYCILDTTEGLRRVLWQVSELPGRVSDIVRSPSVEQFVADGALWRYLLPERRLESRLELPPKQERLQFRLFHAEMQVIDVWLDLAGDFATQLELYTGDKQRSVALREPVALGDGRALTQGDWVALRLHAKSGGPGWYLVHWAQGKICAELAWPSRPGMNSPRLTSTAFTLFDFDGRLLHLDLATGRVTSFALQ